MRSIEVGGDIGARLGEMGRHRTRTVAALGVVACIATGVVVMSRGTPAAIAPPARADATAAAPTSVTVGSVVIVHVAGAVQRPGLYELQVSARVADAIEAAGGPTRRADLDALNLAQLVVDGVKIDVPVRGSAGNTLAAPAASAAPSLISINTADQMLLETIPGIGPVTAAAIIAHREEIGGFDALDQLLDVSGIGPATFESIRSYVTL